MARLIQNPKGGGGAETLPPPGDARRETLRERADQLEEAAETAAPEGGRIDPRAFEVDREIAQWTRGEVNSLSVTGALPERRYCWVPTDQHGLYVKLKAAQGWAVVQGDDPEALELRGIGADTTRRLGDCILMWIRADRYLLLQRAAAAHQRAQEEGVNAALYDLADKAKTTIREFDAPLSPTSARAVNRRVIRRAAARAGGRHLFDRALRKGTVPGMPAPGVRPR